MHLSLSTGVLVLAQTAFTHLTRLTEPAPVTGWNYGLGIAIDPDTLVIGSHAQQQEALGVVHVYRGYGASWTLEAEFEDPTPTNDNHFGRSVALQGDELFVGGFQDAHTTLGILTGSVNIFRRTGATWTHVQLLEPSIPAHLGGYGSEVKVVGDTLVVTGFGCVYVYERQGALWVEQTRLVLNSPAGWALGYSLAFDGLRIAVGSECSTVPGTNCSGKVHLFIRNGTGWIEEQTLSANDAETYGLFGLSVALDGERIAVGAIGRPDQTHEGAVYVFERTGNAWVQVDRVSASDAAPDREFGRSVTLWGDRMYVGAGHAPAGPTFKAGALYAFERTFTGWIEVEKYYAPVPVTMAEFGWRQARSGDNLFVTAVGETHSGLPYAGAVYVVGIEPLTTGYCQSATTSNGCMPRISATGVASATASSGFVLHTDDVEGLRSGLLFYGVSGRTNSPWASSGTAGFLCVKPPTQRMWLQNSGGTFGGCDGVLQIDWNAFRAASPTSLGQPFGVGAIVDAQAWFRDSSAAKATALSNALEFIVRP